MKETAIAMKERLAQLKEELEKGERHLAVLDRQRHETRDTLLRISGAIQVLEELDGSEHTDGSRPVEISAIAAA